MNNVQILYKSRRSGKTIHLLKCASRTGGTYVGYSKQSLEEAKIICEQHEINPVPQMIIFKQLTDGNAFGFPRDLYLDDLNVAIANLGFDLASVAISKPRDKRIHDPKLRHKKLISGILEAEKTAKNLRKELHDIIGLEIDAKIKLDNG